MILSSRKIVVGFFLMSASAAIAMTAACGSDDESKFKDNDATPGTNCGFGCAGDGGISGEGGVDPLQQQLDLYKNDPPPKWCGIDGGTPPAPITGTSECPDDKNLPGCGCETVGQEAPCWQGLRKNRNLGTCADGKTVCKKATENENVWGECTGQTLPKLNATGKEACSCFSVGTWKIANTSPCFWNNGAGKYWAYSTAPPPEGSNQPGKCSGPDHLDPGQKTTENWSTDTLKTDCAGTFKLCFRVKAGDYKNPSPNDCQLGESCVDVNYVNENQEQVLPPMPSWNSENSECVKKWEIDTPALQSPGYGEMVVVGGKTIACESVSNVPEVDEFVFNRVQYCPTACRDAANKDLPECVQCQLAGKGSF